MRVVRQTLGDSGRTQQFIQTRRGHGYRIVVAVTVLQDSETETALPPPTTTEPLDDRIPPEPRPSPPHLEPEPDRTGLAALLDQLPPSAQSLLQAAAVIGSEVSFPLLQAVTGVPLETLAPSLAHLQTAGRLAEARRLPKLVYTFVPPLTQQVVYAALPHEQQRVLHAQVAEALAQHCPARVADIAYHAFRGEVWDTALAYSRQAGEQAAASAASRQAVMYFEQALASIQHLPTQHDTLMQMIDLQLHLSNVLMALGDLGRVVDSLRAAESLAETLDDGRRLGRVCALLAFAHWLAGDYQGAIAPGRRALAIANVLDDFAPHVRARLILGQVYLVLGDYADAHNCFRQNIAYLTDELRYNLLGMPGLPAVLSRAWLAWSLAEL